jgi:hypothetical protein
MTKACSWAALAALLVLGLVSETRTPPLVSRVQTVDGSRYSSGAGLDSTSQPRAFDSHIDFERKEFRTSVELPSSWSLDDRSSRGEIGVEFEVFGQDRDLRVVRALVESESGVLVAGVEDLLPSRKPAQLRARLFLAEGGLPGYAGEPARGFREMFDDEFAVVVIPEANGRHREVSADAYVPATDALADSVEFRVRSGFPSDADEGEGGDHQ